MLVLKLGYAPSDSRPNTSCAHLRNRVLATLPLGTGVGAGIGWIPTAPTRGSSTGAGVNRVTAALTQGTSIGPGTGQGTGTCVGVGWIGTSDGWTLAIPTQGTAEPCPPWEPGQGLPWPQPLSPGEQVQAQGKAGPEPPWEQEQAEENKALSLQRGSHRSGWNRTKSPLRCSLQSITVRR